MGSVIGKSLDENMKKSQQDMLERQIQMNNYMREQQMAMMIAKSRDLFHYWAAFYSLVLVGAIAGLRKRRPLAVAPVIPVSFIVAYLGDMAYGNKLQRIQGDAREILKQESHLLDLPSGLPNVAILDERRQK